MALEKTHLPEDCSRNGFGEFDQEFGKYARALGILSIEGLFRDFPEDLICELDVVKIHC